MYSWHSNYAAWRRGTFSYMVEMLSHILSICAGFFIAWLYYDFILVNIPFIGYYGTFPGIIFGFVYVLAIAVCSQLRCINLLLFPMYFGKPGRGVLKTLVLTYVVAGPITNMGLNAKEVVRVYACSTQLAHNLTKAKHALMAQPFRDAMVGLRDDIPQVNQTLREFGDVLRPIENEILNPEEIARNKNTSDGIDDVVKERHRSDEIERKFQIMPNDTENVRYLKLYLKKVEYSCEDQISKAMAMCIKTFSDSYDACVNALPKYAGRIICWPLKITYICNVIHAFRRSHICDSRLQIDPGIGIGFVYLERAKREMVHDIHDVWLQYKLNYVRELENIQDAKETSELVLHAFHEKEVIMHYILTLFNIAEALLFLKLFTAAVSYHDFYLTKIDHDNTYITGYFKRIDSRRRDRGRYRLLPLEKMERLKYTDVLSFSWCAHERFLMQALKVFLEVVTATTFVMLDRMFYEALDVVRKHAEVSVTQQGTHNLDIKVEGKGLLAELVRKILTGLNSKCRVNRTVSNKECLPRPRLMPWEFFVKIYGGYLWILLLLYLNPYTMRLKRLICSHFYPRREKQRILHLYNDILKKRLKMYKTLRKIAVQSIRAHYLSGETMLSLSMKFPNLFGWLRVFPAARMTCLICGETEPRNSKDLCRPWVHCESTQCPFAYCPECWCNIGQRCLACDPSLAELSDVDSLSEDDPFNNECAMR